ncbi:hypothetical protein C8T65DRAFT_699878 [Cerioporus squamosus]|nr:hypothetical protein C8T65DRAFT_699878 [Cerioporus squamosus]
MRDEQRASTGAVSAAGLLGLLTAPEDMNAGLDGLVASGVVWVSGEEVRCTVSLHLSTQEQPSRTLYDSEPGWLSYAVGHEGDASCAAGTRARVGVPGGWRKKNAGDVVHRSQASVSVSASSWVLVGGGREEAGSGGQKSCRRGSSTGPGYPFYQ